MNLVPGDEAVNVDDDDEAEAKLLIKKHHCSICDTAMDSYLLDESRKLHICGDNPDCNGFEVDHLRSRSFCNNRFSCCVVNEVLRVWVWRSF